MKVWLSRDKGSADFGDSRDYYLSFRRPHNIDDVGFVFWHSNDVNLTLIIDPRRFHRDFFLRLKPGEGPIQIDIELSNILQHRKASSIVGR